MAKSEEWRRGFRTGALVVGLVVLVPILICCLWGIMARQGARVQAQTVEIQQGTISQLQAGLTKCRGTSQGNYDVAIRAQEENRQLRELVSEYQVQIQKGQAPADLAVFLLKLLIP